MIALLFLAQGVLFITYGGGTIPEGPYHDVIIYAFAFFLLGVGALLDICRHLVEIKTENRAHHNKRSWER